MFIDDVKIKVKAGDGGAGMVAFRREKYVPKGGPAGGNGGRGGNIVFVGDEGLTTLLDLHYRKSIKAENGENGKSKNGFGRDGADQYIRVPLGSVVYDVNNNTVISDITKHNQEAVVARGGRGGRGNTAFATSRVPAPDYREAGERGVERELRVELKILADVGLVGFPSVGKSTLISVISAARPKIAAYPFTTLYPNLGVARCRDGRSFVVADLPGLIEGASQGAGLGIRFLRHIERTRVIVHVIDIAGSEGRDPYRDYLTINRELENYNPRLLLRPQIIAANKMDLPGTEENLKILKSKLPDITIVAISAYTKNNLDELLYRISDLLDTIKPDSFREFKEEATVEYKFTPEPDPFVIEKDTDGVYNVVGPMIEKYFNATDFNRDANVKMFARRLRNLGVEDALRKLGVKSGDAVRILGYEFELFD
ncbi:MAG: GTPase ObgE [Bacilli bacterium]|nr:GTPase ObgE [Bacilli bacterium]MDD4077686.1 GTPase ObgE [Bacilli bacterium]